MRLILAFAAALPLIAADQRFPADAGIVDVTAEPYLADCSGASDATAAIQRALDENPSANRIIYLPKGTYLISDTLRWPGGRGEGQAAKRTILQGEHRDETILRLRDACPGFGAEAAQAEDDQGRPQGKAMIWTGVAPAQRFRNAIRNLTIDLGAGNPGAIGARFNTSNQGGVFEVTIRAGADSGRIGLDLGYTGEIGPMLVRNLRVVGCDIGVHSWGAVNSITMQDVHLEGQRTVGISNFEQVLSIEGLIARDVPLVIDNRSGGGVLTLIGAALTTDRPAEAAIRNRGYCYARDLAATGYALAVANQAGTKADVAGPAVDEYVSHQPLANAFAPEAVPRALHLPIRRSPEVPWDPPETWASPLAYGGMPSDGGDDTAAIQAAIDSGATTVYLPNGTWQLSGTLELRGNVRRFLGCEASVIGESVIDIVAGTADVVAIERLEFLPIHEPGPRLRHTAKRTAVLSNLRMRRVGKAYEALPGSGDCFVNDCAGDSWHFVAGQRAWLRQVNPEGDTPMLVNEGADLWVLGLKTENDGPALHASGGRTEILGAFIYANSRRDKNPLFVLEGGAAFSVTMGESSFRQKPFTQLVVETRSGETRIVGREAAARRGEGSAIGLFSTAAVP